MLTDEQVTQLRAMLERNEGRMHRPYRDTTGKLTIGVGRNLDSIGLSNDEIDLLLTHDIEDARRYLISYPWFSILDAVRQMVLIDMMFEMGPAGFAHFTGMHAALSAGNYLKAADMALASAWAQQVPSRAYRDARMLLTGEMS